MKMFVKAIYALTYLTVAFVIVLSAGENEYYFKKTNLYPRMHYDVY